MGSAVRKLLFLGTSAVALTASLFTAQAGGFATRDQSAVGEGMAFGGEGTPGMGLSAMFWNPAAVTQVKSWGVEGDVSVAFPRGTLTTNPALTSPATETLNSCTGGVATCDQTGNMFKTWATPAFYGAYRFAPDWYLGLSVTSPFGMKTQIPGTGNPPAPLSYAAQQLGTGANIRSVDVNPVVGWKVNNVLSLAIGPQFLWWRNDFDRDLFPLFSGGAANLEAMIATQTHAFGVGLTAGITYAPSPATEIALGYRSQVRLDLNGRINIPPSLALLAAPVTAPFSGTAPSVTSGLTLPDQVNLGVRQRLNDSWTVLGTVEWTRWSGTQGAPFIFTNGPAPGQIGDFAHFNYRDGWYLSAGAEYRATAATTLRAGIGYDVSPVNGTLGWVNIPGANSTTASIGVSHKLTDRLTVDAGYSYTWIANQQIFVGPGNPEDPKLDTLIPGIFNWWGGNVSSHNQVLSVALRYTSDPPASAIDMPVKAASAGHMPVKAPPLAPPTTYLWSGFYIGANAGVALTTTNDTITATGIPGLATTSERLGGAVGGGQIGYNWQWDRVVLGVEADIDASSQSGSSVNVLAAPGGFASHLVSTTDDIRDFGTARARLGLPFDRFMPYVTGGFAWQHVSTTLNGIALAPLPTNTIFPIMSNSATLSGWTIGGGVETALGGRWTARAEYLYIDTGRLNTTTGPLPATSPVVTSGFAPAGSVISESTRVANNVIRVGVSYYFGGVAGP